MKYYYRLDGRDIILNVPGSVYYPEDDSEMFADFIVKNRIMFLRKKVLEIGCGSGLLAMICARFGADVLATDINPDAVGATNENAKLNKISLDALQSDLFEKIRGKFDIILFNAPYLPDEDELTKKAYSQNYSKSDVIKRFLAQYRNYLEKGGRAFILISSITSEKINGKIVAKRKLDWEELRILELK